MPGVTIGDDTVIGAGSVVTRDLPADVVAVGIPCRVVREIGDHDRVYYSRDKEFDVPVDELIRRFNSGDCSASTNESAHAQRRSTADLGAGGSVSPAAHTRSATGTRDGQRPDHQWHPTALRERVHHPTTAGGQVIEPAVKHVRFSGTERRASGPRRARQDFPRRRLTRRG